MGKAAACKQTREIGEEASPGTNQRNPLVVPAPSSAGSFLEKAVPRYS